MSGPQPDVESTRPISVAELLARNGTIGSPPVTGRRRRLRGNADAVTVAELTGEIPVVSDHELATDRDGPARAAFGAGTIGWSEPRPRWPQSPPPRRAPGPERSHYRRPVRPAAESGAERMSPDPVEDYTSVKVDVMDTDVRGVDLATEDSAYVRAQLRGGSDEPGPAGPTLERFREDGRDNRDGGHTDVEAEPGEPAEEYSSGSELLGGGLIVLQSIVAVVFGAGLFIAFDQLWRWNDIVALVLTVLVTLGLVASVQAVRKTVDIGSTLIAVAVGLLTTLGPLALHAG
jgi:hypothetical protein